MPFEEVTLFDGVFEVVYTGYLWNDWVVVYSVPSTVEGVKELIEGKKAGRVPRILRVHLYYRVEYLDRTFDTKWGYSIYMVDCRGDERVVREHSATWLHPVDEGDVDVSDLYDCTAPSLGLNAAKLRLEVPQYIFPWGFKDRAKYRVTVRAAWSWGW